MSTFITERHWSLHRGYLHPEVGAGLLVLPRPGEDVYDPTPTTSTVVLGDGTVALTMSPPTLADAELDLVLDELRTAGWSPVAPQDELAEWVEAGETADGRLAVLLVKHGASAPTVAVNIAAFLALRVAAGVAFER